MERTLFRIKQRMQNGSVIYDIQAYLRGNWYAVCKGNRSMNEVYEFFSSAKVITWNEDGLSGSYSF